MSRFVSVHAGGCGDHGVVSDGVIPTVSGTAVGDTVTYTCRHGYTLSGSSTRTCQPNGSWSDIAPKCIRKYCIARMCRVHMRCKFCANFANRLHSQKCLLEECF